MIFAISISIAIAAVTVSADGSTPPPYHVYEIPAPAEPGVFRVRISDEATKLWAIEQIQSVSIFDNAGKQQGCEWLRQSRLGATKKSYPLAGTWRDIGDLTPPARGSYGPLHFAWRFAMPAFAANESPYYLHFNWRSNVSNPGEMRLVEIPPDKNPQRSLIGIHLMDGQSNSAKGHVNLYLYSEQPRAWAPDAEIQFTLSQDELTVESPVLDTLTKKPWTLTPAGGPGWIIFKGNGNAPYRLQLGESLYGCGGANVTDMTISYADPEWPPEVVAGAEIENAPHVGETQASWHKQIEQREGTQARGSWTVWGFWIGLAFAVALGISLKPNKR